MIQVASNRILINQTGPSPFTFDINDLHDKLTSSFHACGVKNSWMADDILIAVHRGLNVDGRPLTEESLDQLHAALIKILQDNGFPEVATHFSQSLQNNSTGELLNKILFELQNIKTAVKSNVAQKVLNKI